MSVISAAIVIISAVYQNQQMEDMKRRRQQKEEAAKRQADLNKGMRFPVTGEPADLSIPYGRVLIGGAAVYRKIASSYNYASPGAGAAVLTTSGSDRFGSSQGGSKNEFLLMQQAISAAGINLVENIIIDDKNLKGDAVDSDGNVVSPAYPGASIQEPLAGSARFIIYLDGNIADPVMVANEASRNTATFSNTAYATQLFWLNRDDQQYSGEPAVQYLVQGMKVPTIVGSKGSRTLGSKVFSKNSVLCLLDYLTNTQYGLGIGLDKLDLDSFYDAYLIADRIVKTDILSSSDAVKLGFATPGIGAVPTSREVRLYECNLAVESSKPLRDNVTSILETITDAILIWTGGKYKLRVDYPLIYVNSTTYPAGTKVQHGLMLYNALVSTSQVPGTGADWEEAVNGYITDDDIVRDATTSINWPNAQTRLNFATVKFQNETKNFKNDKASWPPKTGALYSQYLAEDSGVKLETEQEFTGCNNYYAALAKAEYLVRSSRASVTYELSLTQKFFDVEPGDILKLTSEVLGVPGDLIRVTSVTPGDDATIAISGYRFDANTLAWNVSDTEVSTPRRLFTSKLGVATGLSFSNASSGNFNSAGKLSWSDAADNRVVQYIVKYSEGAIGSSTKWKELGRTGRGPAGIASFELPVMIPSSFNLAVISTDYTSYTAQADYPTLRVTTESVSGNVLQSVKLTLYKRSATAPSTPSGGIYNFPSKTLGNVPAGWSTTQMSGIQELYVSYAIATTDGFDSSSTDFVWSTPAKIGNGLLSIEASKPVLGVLQREDLSLDYNSAFGTVIAYDGTSDVTTDALTTFTIVDAIDCVAVISTVSPNKGEYYVTGLIGIEASFKIAFSRNTETTYKTIFVKLAGNGYIKDTTAPSAPTGLSVSASSSTVFIDQIKPAYTQGRGHSYTQVWWSAVNNVANAIKLDEFAGNFYTIPITPGDTKYLWFKWVSKDGVFSDFSSVYSITSTKITSTQIGDQEIQTPNLAANAITADKCAVGMIEADSAIIANGAITNAKIGNVIQSESYVAGSAGWKIDKNGDIELNSAVFRGTLNVVGPGASRMEVRSNVMKVFNSNVLVVKIGDLSA